MEKTQQPQKPAEAAESADLDAALEEKFQQVEEDLDHFRTLNDTPIADAKPAASKEPAEEAPAEEPAVVPEEAPSAVPAQEKTPEQERETARERKARYKQRRQMLITTRIGAVLRTFTLSAILLGGSIFLLVGARPTESAEENRKLAEFPAFSKDALLDGSYTADLMNYYEDTVPGRSTFKRLISTMESYAGLQGEEDVKFYGDITQLKNAKTTTAPAEDSELVSSETLISSVTEKSTTTTVTTEPEADPVEIGDGIVLVDKRAISVYGGSFTRGEAYAATLNAYHKELGSAVNVYSLVAPTAVSFYLPSSYASYTASEWDNIQHINENLDGVIPVDAYSALEKHTDENIYARTDHHWLPLGAFYAAQAFADTADLSFPPLSAYQKTTLSGYLGSMYTFTKSAVLRDNPEDFTYYTPKNKFTTQYYDTDFTNEADGDLMISLDNVEPVSWYLVFMGGDEKITHVKTDCNNARTLVIVKDSYGNALVPYLTQSFEDIYVIDMRYFDINAVSFMKQVGATDVLFAMNTFSATGANSECLETIRTQ